MGTKLKDEKSIELIISEMSLEEKAKLVTGGSPFTSEPFDKYGIPDMIMLDGGTGFNSFQYASEIGYRMAVLRHIEEANPIDRETLSGMGGLLIGLREAQLDVKAADEGESTEKKAYGCYPPGMLFGATWNKEPIEACGHALGKEMGSLGIDIILGTPNVNIHRDPLGGRLFEGYSEDPHLVSALAPAFVKSIQAEGVIANVKHFAANNQETNRMGVNEHIPERALQEIYFPGFKACIDAGCMTVMSAYNKINGLPAAMNPWLLTTVLREEWGFEGFVVSDWSGAYDQVAAVEAGNDLAMPGPRGIKGILDAVKSGKLEEKKLDNCIRNFLKILLKAPVMTAKTFTFDIGEAVSATEFAAREGITLLKNNGVLPISKDTKVAFYGKRSKNFAACGAGSAFVNTTLNTNPYDSAINLIGKDKVTFHTATEDTKIMLVTVGANGQEGADRPHMDMNAEDREALEQAIADAQKNNGKVILILNAVGPVSLMDYIDKLDAIVCTYYPGMQGGKVLIDILFGDVNPSGKLPFSYPKYYRDCPTFKNFPGENNEVWYGEGIYVGYRYYDAKKIEPLYPFGHGLSYTNFEMFDLKVADEINVDQNDVNLSVKVKNIGNKAGAEVVQIYIHDVISKLDKPVKELKGFQKVFLEPEEVKEIHFSIQKKDLAGYCMEMKEWVCEPGEFELLLGNSSANIILTKKIMIHCKNPFGLKENTTIGEVVANEQAIKLINAAINVDIMELANEAIVFYPQRTWKEIWSDFVTPVLTKRGIDETECNLKYQQIISKFQQI